MFNSRFFLTTANELSVDGYKGQIACGPYETIIRYAADCVAAAALYSNPAKFYHGTKRFGGTLDFDATKPDFSSQGDYVILYERVGDIQGYPGLRLGSLFYFTRGSTNNVPNYVSPLALEMANFHRKNPGDVEFHTNAPLSVNKWWMRPIQ